MSTLRNIKPISIDIGNPNKPVDKPILEIDHKTMSDMLLRSNGRVLSHTMHITFVDNAENASLIRCNPRITIDGNNRRVKTAAKVSVSGSKYIGIQQDKYEIVIQNLPAYLIAEMIEAGKRNIIIGVEDIFRKVGNMIPVFSGQIVNVTGAWVDFHTYESKFTCLRKASIFLNSMVAPFTTNSSMNYHHIISQLIPAEHHNLIPRELNNIKFNRDDYVISGDRKTVLNDIIDMLNERVKEHSWYDVTYKPNGTIDIFNVFRDDVTIRKVEGYSGMIGLPKIDDNGITFEHIYQDWISPGAVVKMDNKYLDTRGATTAYLFTMDPNEQYVITQVDYQFETLSGQTFRAVCQAFPRSKYNNWHTK